MILYYNYFRIIWIAKIWKIRAFWCSNYVFNTFQNHSNLFVFITWKIVIYTSYNHWHIIVSIKRYRVFQVNRQDTIYDYYNDKCTQHSLRHRVFFVIMCQSYKYFVRFYWVLIFWILLYRYLHNSLKHHRVYWTVWQLLMH